MSSGLISVSLKLTWSTDSTAFCGINGVASFCATTPSKIRKKKVSQRKIK